jgi:threonine/homoserine/homoserine lactone efflux protein
MSFVIPLVLFLIPLAFSPGPGNLFFAALSARFGARATVPALVGYHVATLGITFIIGLGFELGTGGNQTVTRLLGGVGSIYVLYLAWKIANAQIDLTTSNVKPASFMNGFLLLSFNPKAYVIIALLFTQFPPAQLTPSNPMLGSLLISTAFTAHNLFAFIVWIAVSSKIGSGFRTQSNFQLMNFVFGGLLAVVAVWLFVMNWT